MKSFIITNSQIDSIPNHFMLFNQLSIPLFQSLQLTLFFFNYIEVSLVDMELKSFEFLLMDFKIRDEVWN